LTLGRAVEVVGESYYPEAYEAVVGSAAVPLNLLAVLLPEPDNKYDPAAVAVVVDGHKAGHLSKADARGFRRQIDAAIRSHGTAAVLAQITGGPGRYGIYLEPGDLLPFGRQAIEDALYRAGYVNYDEDADGFGITNEPNGAFTVWNGGDDGDVATEVAKRLRDYGFAARVQNRSGGGKGVRVTGWN
jgi:hypothetical protein